MYRFREICLVCLPIWCTAHFGSPSSTPAFFSLPPSTLSYPILSYPTTPSSTDLLACRAFSKNVRPVIFLVPFARPPCNPSAQVSIRLSSIRGDKTTLVVFPFWRADFRSTPLPISAAAVSRQGTGLPPSITTSGTLT
ncbi:hypothetical protein F4820DRAFT_71652 [Hypoxylon rubiginosum]|uniref:Uncharacterized protein n=1 Tax=Hypoxylon rubiginosum TaxID=110542 RepID=A0ACB9YPH7_9PEZI|nr:hypothetical protein F4820DRAFT_71652 [Hypoxylon rubiginosum]